MLPILNTHIKTLDCCEICSTYKTISPSTSPVAFNFSNVQRQQLSSDRHNYQPDLTNLPVPSNHGTLTTSSLDDMATLLHHISSIADTSNVPKYTSTDDMTQTLQHLHLGDMLEYEDDGSSADGPNDIDISNMLPDVRSMDYDLGGSSNLQQHLIALMEEYRDIFSYNVKGKAMQVPPMQFTVFTDQWESNLNRLPSRHISVEKHDALNKMIDDLLDLQVIQPSKATAWSQVHLVRKPAGDGVSQWTTAA